MPIRALVAAEPATQKRLVRLWSERGVPLALLPGGEPLWERLTREDYDLVLAGTAALPATSDQLTARLDALPDRPALVALTDRDDPRQRATLLAAGCHAVLWLGLPDRLLADTLVALAHRRSEALLTRLGAERSRKRSTLGDFVSSSPSMHRFVDLARRVANADTAILILGETGVGKERLARSIHYESGRTQGPFVPVNCGALPEGLLESELFGHEEGAFTGATRARRGYFELAHRGTLFLDEIGDMPLHLQVKLLRSLEGQQIRRVGGERPVDIDVRVMAATNRDLGEAMESGLFRKDLYYRLAVVTLTIPPLRERRDDIPELAQTFLRQSRARFGRAASRFHPQALQALLDYEWPGNVRELINVIERAVLLSSGDEIEASDLFLQADLSVPDDGLDEAKRSAERSPAKEHWLGQTLHQARESWVSSFERNYLSALLRETRGRIGETARRAGINERTLYNLMQRHRLRKEDFRGV